MVEAPSGPSTRPSAITRPSTTSLTGPRSQRSPTIECEVGGDVATYKQMRSHRRLQHGQPQPARRLVLGCHCTACFLESHSRSWLLPPVKGRLHAPCQPYVQGRHAERRDGAGSRRSRGGSRETPQSHGAYGQHGCCPSGEAEEPGLFMMPDIPITGRHLLGRSRGR